MQRTTKRLLAGPIIAAGFIGTGLAAAGFGAAGLASSQPEDQMTPNEQIQQTIDALYDVISGDEGEPRDWDRFLSLFHENALMHVIPASGSSQTFTTLQPVDYVERSGPFLDQSPFYEEELSSIVEVYGGLAHVFSTYEITRTPSSPKARGINSIQLCFDPESKAWKVLSISWTGEQKDNPIPAQYLPAKESDTND